MLQIVTHNVMICSRMKSRTSSPLGRWVEHLLSQGRYTFTKREALRHLRCSPEALHMALWRLGHTKWVVMPRRGFYVIVDPQHRSAGTLPPEWFIHDLMKDIGRSYYVGLLSAAQLHGSAHHQPQIFQVVTPRGSIRPIHAGNVRIRFHEKSWFNRSTIVEVKTPTGLMKASSPETTAWDVVWFLRAAGGLNHVTTILAELTEQLTVQHLHKTMRQHGELVVAQRLGYLLDRLGRADLTKPLAQWAKTAPAKPLDPAAPILKASMNRKWNLLINATVEPECATTRWLSA